MMTLAQSVADPCAPCGGDPPPPCENPTATLWESNNGNEKYLDDPACALGGAYGSWRLLTCRTTVFQVVHEGLRPCLEWEAGVAYDITLAVEFSADGYEITGSLHLWQLAGESVIRHAWAETIVIPDLIYEDDCVLGPGGSATVASDWDITGPRPVRAVLELSYGSERITGDCVLATCVEWDPVEEQEVEVTFARKRNLLYAVVSVEVDAPV